MHHYHCCVQKVLSLSVVRSQVKTQHFPMSKGDSTITPAHHVRNLGVQVDRHLSTVPNVTAICASCNYHLYRLSSIRRYLAVNVTRTVVQALITSRLDYCNSLMINIPSTQMERLQKIQNKAARMISRVPSSQHITPVLQQLHWLPVRCRIAYRRSMVTVFKCFHALTPTYLIELLEADSWINDFGIQILHFSINQLLESMWENRNLARRHHFYGIICLRRSGP